VLILRPAVLVPRFALVHSGAPGVVDRARPAATLLDVRFFVSSRHFVCA
jgi:hypothetical protein